MEKGVSLGTHCAQQEGPRSPRSKVKVKVKSEVRVTKCVQSNPKGMAMVALNTSFNICIFLCSKMDEPLARPFWFFLQGGVNFLSSDLKFGVG